MKQKKTTQVLSAALAAVSAISIVSPALAVQVSGDRQNVPIELTVEKPTFSVTMPTGLPVAVDAAGKVYCSTNATIKNNTFGQVKVSNVAIEGNASWSVAAWDTDMQKEKVNTAKIAMQLNGGITTAAGYDFQPSNFPVMDGHSSMSLTYDAKLPAQTKVIGGDTVANVVFTVGWNTEDGSSTPTPTPPPAKPSRYDISGLQDKIQADGKAHVKVGDTITLNAAAVYGTESGFWSCAESNVLVIDKNTETQVIARVLGSGDAILRYTNQGVTEEISIHAEEIKTPTPPVMEANTTSYIPEGKTLAHTVYWAQGITPPTLPNQILADGSKVKETEADFTMIDALGHVTTRAGSKNGYAYLVAPFDPNGGWYDVNKHAYYAPDRNIQDSSYCWAATSAALTSYWLDQHKSEIQQMLDLIDQGVITPRGDLADPKKLVQIMQQKNSLDPMENMVYSSIIDAYKPLGNHGGHTIMGTDTFINGYAPTMEKSKNDPNLFDKAPSKLGGYLYPVFGKSSIGYTNYYTQYDAINPIFKDYFTAGYAVSIGYKTIGGYHAVPVWGAEYDDNDQLVAIYLSDSNDAGLDGSIPYWDHNKVRKEASLIRYDAYKYQRDGQLAIGTKAVVDKNSGSILDHICLMDPAHEEFAYFLEHFEPMYQDGRELITYDDYLDPMHRKG